MGLGDRERRELGMRRGDNISRETFVDSLRSRGGKLVKGRSDRDREEWITSI